MTTIWFYPCSAPGCDGRCGECFRVVDEDDPMRAAYRAVRAKQEALGVARCYYCTSPEADPMVVVNDQLPALAGKRFHAGCFREALEKAVLELEARGEVTIDRVGRP